MDIFSHALWTNLIFKEVPMEQRSFIISFSVMPDLVSFLKIGRKDIWKKVSTHKPSNLKEFPDSVHKLYNYTHSLVVWAGLVIVLKLLSLGLVVLLMYGWALHIIADIFTHSKKFFPTPVFWPISNYKFSGVPWSNKWFMVFNYSALVLFYSVFYF